MAKEKKETWISPSRFATFGMCEARAALEPFQPGGPEAILGNRVNDLVVAALSMGRLEKSYPEEVAGSMEVFGKQIFPKINLLDVAYLDGQSPDGPLWRVLNLPDGDKTFAHLPLNKTGNGIRGTPGDCVETPEEGAIVVWDFKNGLNPASRDQADAEAVLAAGLWPDRPVIVRFTYLNPNKMGERIEEWSYGAEEIASIKRALVKAGNRIELLKSDPAQAEPSLNSYCGYCGLVGTCPVASKFSVDLPNRFLKPPTTSAEFEALAGAIEQVKHASKLIASLDEKLRANRSAFLGLHNGRFETDAATYEAKEVPARYDYPQELTNGLLLKFGLDPLACLKFESGLIESDAKRLPKEKLEEFESTLKQIRTISSKREVVTRKEKTVAKAIEAETVPATIDIEASTPEQFKAALVAPVVLTKEEEEAFVKLAEEEKKAFAHPDFPFQNQELAARIVEAPEPEMADGLDWERLVFSQARDMAEEYAKAMGKVILKRRLSLFAAKNMDDLPNLTQDELLQFGEKLASELDVPDGGNRLAKWREFKANALKYRKPETQIEAAK